MFVLLLVLIAVLFGFGFLDPIWWVAAAVLVYAATRRGRDRGGGRSRSGSGDLGDYRDYRSAGIVGNAGTAATAVRTGRAGGARTVGTANTAGDR